MITSFLSRIFTSLPVKLLMGAFVLLAMASQAVPQLVDTKPYVEKLAAAVRINSGGTLLVKDGSHLQVLPRLALVLKGAEISQPNVEHAPSVNIDAAELAIDLPSLLSGEPQVNLVRAAGVSLVAERLPTGGANWGFLGLPLLKTLSTLKSDHPVQVEILSGRATIGDVKTGETYGISQLQAIGVIDKETTIHGSLTYKDMPLQFSIARSGAMGATPVELSLASGGNSISLKGDMDFTADFPVVTGKMEIAAEDISSYLGAASPVKNGEKTAAVPLKLSANYAQRQGLVALSDIAMESLNSKADGSFSWDTTKLNDYKASLHFTTLDMGGVKQLVLAYLASVNTQQDTHAPRTLVSKSLNMSLDITADAITNGAQSWKKAGFDGTFSDGVLTVNKLSFALPGDSTLALFGLVSISDTQGLRFEGNSEAKGSSLRDLLTVFDESASNLPALGFGAYSLRSNLFISKELLRLSEADAKFSELALKGGLVAYFDRKPRIEAEVGLRDINFDYFRDSWRTSTVHSEKNEQGELFLRFDRNMNFDWLKRLAATIDFKVSVEGFTFLERKGKNSSFRLFAQGGELGVYNAKFAYGTDTTEANLKLDVNGEQPLINLVLNTASLNTNYFALNPIPPEPVLPAAPVKNAEKATPPATKEALPDMAMPEVTPEEEMRKKIAEEAAQAMKEGVGNAATPATPAAPEKTAPVVIIPKVTLEAAPEAATPATPTKPTAEEATPTVPVVPAPAVVAPAPVSPEVLLQNDAMPEDGVSEDGAVLDETGDTVNLEGMAPPTIKLKPLTHDRGAWNLLRGLFIREALAQEGNLAMPIAAAPALPLSAPPPVDVPENELSKRWANIPIDMSMMEGIGGTFDISVGTLTHKNLVFQNFKMLTKLERNLLTFQTLTFVHWGGSFSINGTIFGGKVPGLSIGFIIASVDIQQMLEAMLHINTVGGRASISGTIDTSGLNMLSWISQATGKLLVAGRGVSIRGFDMASVMSAVQASRTAADVFNSVNMAVVGGTGDYSADGAINLQKGIISTPGIALKTGRVIGNVSGDFRLLPWDINLSGNFKFPELSTENVPTMNVRWSGAVENPSLQTDTQSLEAFASKRITGN